MQSASSNARDLLVIAAIVIAFLGVGMASLVASTWKTIPRFDQVEILTSIQSFIPDHVWLMAQTIRNNKEVAIVLTILASANAAAASYAAQKVNDGSWSTFWTVTVGLVVFLVEAVLLLGSYCVYEENRRDTYHCG